MKSYVEDRSFVVALTHLETCRLSGGERIHDRRSPFGPMEKVAVRPLQEYDPGYTPDHDFNWLRTVERLKELRCRAHLTTDPDLTVYVPMEVARYALIAAEHIPVDQVDITLQEEEREDFLTHLGIDFVTIRFDSVETEL